MHLRWENHKVSGRTTFSGRRDDDSPFSRSVRSGRRPRGQARHVTGRVTCGETEESIVDELPSSPGEQQK